MAMSIKPLVSSYRSYKLYDVTFYDDTITTLVTATACIADTWISDMEHLHQHRLRRLVVGLDCEWRPNFYHDGGDLSDRVATLQLCIGKNCLIFQLIHAKEIPQSLKNFLSNMNYTFVGVGVDEDANKLYDHYGLDVARTVDLRQLAADCYGDWSLRKAGLKKLAMEVLNKDMEKPKRVTLSDWAVESLTFAQIHYAGVDAFVSFEIGRVLKAAGAEPLRVQGFLVSSLMSSLSFSPPRRVQASYVNKVQEFRGRVT